MVDGSLREDVDGEGGHNSEVVATSTQSPVEVCIGGLARCYDGAIGKNDLKSISKVLPIALLILRRLPHTHGYCPAPSRVCLRMARNHHQEHGHRLLPYRHDLRRKNDCMAQEQYRPAQSLHHHQLGHEWHSRSPRRYSSDQGRLSHRQQSLSHLHFESGRHP